MCSCTSTARRSIYESGQPMIMPVFRLIFQRNPLAIARLVITVIVDAFNRVAFRARSHVCQESLKTVPSFADLNASTAVAVKSLVFWVGASLAHHKPDRISRFSLAVSPDAMTVRLAGAASVEKVSPKATARTGVTSQNCAAGDRGCLTAIALTNPAIPFPDLFRSKDNETADTLSRSIFEPHTYRG